MVVLATSSDSEALRAMGVMASFGHVSHVPLLNSAVASALLDDMNAFKGEEALVAKEELEAFCQAQETKVKVPDVLPIGGLVQAVSAAKREANRKEAAGIVLAEGFSRGLQCSLR